MTRETIRLSVAMIARDDAEAIGETIRSIRRFVDEVVVMDTGSQDSSRDVAKKLDARVFEFPWCDDFSAARNACLEQIRGQWVLWLDAGESMKPDQIAALNQFVLSDADPDKVYALVVNVPPNARMAAAEQIARIRLIPNHRSLRYVGRVRETLADSIVRAELQVEGLPYRIERGAREHDLQRRSHKAQRNIRLAERAIREGSPTASLLNCLGDACQTLDDGERAARFFRNAIKLAEPQAVDLLEAYYGLLTSLDGPGTRQEQIDIAVKACAVFPLDAQLLCAMGGYLQAAGRMEVAAQCYETAYRYGQINPVVWHVAEVREIAAICYSITLQLQNDLDGAQQALEAALTTSSSSVRVRRHLIELLVRRARRDEALEQVRQLPEEFPHRQAFGSAVRGACLAVKKNWIAANAYLKTAYTAGCRETLCLKWLAVSLISSGEQAAALPVLREWHEAEPGNSEAKKMLEAARPSNSTEASSRTLRVDLSDMPERTSPPSKSGLRNRVD